MTTPYSSGGPTSRPAGEDYHPQGLRQFLHTSIMPYFKKALKQSLEDEPDNPLRYLGEHLIHQSLLYDTDPQKLEIREHFQYKFDTPRPAPSETPVPQPEHHPAEQQIVEPVLQPALATQQVQAAAMNGLVGGGHVNGQGEGQGQQSEDAGAGMDVEMKGTEEEP